MIDSKNLLNDLQMQRCDQDPQLDAPLQEEYDAAKKPGRTVLTYQAWRDGGLAQVALAWVLVPGNEQSDRPTLNHKAIPLSNPAQHVRLNRAWLANKRRA